MPWSKNGSNDGSSNGNDGSRDDGGPDQPSGPSTGSGGGGTPSNPWGAPPGGGRSRPSSPEGRGTGGGGPGRGSPSGRASGLDDALRQGGDRLRAILGGGGGGRGGNGRRPTGGPSSFGWSSARVVGLGVAAVAMLWLLSGIYRVAADEQGVVLRFGKPVRVEQPGLRYHLPAPFERVLLPKVTRVNRIEIGYRSGGDDRRAMGDSDVPDESTMLTGDENIVDIDFTVFWVIKDPAKFLFNIRDPEETVKKVAESAMREIIGRTEIQPALTDARQRIEDDSRKLLQSILDQYEAGIEITQVQLQRVEPPAAVVEAFNDVQRARQDRERSRNEAETYRNDIIPRARGNAQKLIQDAEGYRQQVVDLAQGDAQRFQKVLAAYAQAPDAAARRMYIETMEQILKGTRKILLDGKAGGGAVPYLPLDNLMKTPRQAAPSTPLSSLPAAADPPASAAPADQ